MERQRDYQCSGGCGETAFFLYRNQREYQSLPGVWTCLRCAKPNEVLSPTNLATEVTIVLNQEFSYGRFWEGGSGLKSGPGFQAYAGDFPLGTRLIVTARIILPGE